jgi:hypothetical protein
VTQALRLGQLLDGRDDACPVEARTTADALDVLGRRRLQDVEARLGRVASVLMPRSDAASTPADHSSVLPMPASPERTIGPEAAFGASSTATM